MRRFLIQALVVVTALASLGFEWEGRLSRLTRELESGDPARRREVVRLLAAYPASAVREPLLEALGDPDAGVRAEAAEAAGAVRLREAVPRLLDWLDDPDADVRASAARALGRIGEERAVSSLVRALGDAHADVRRAAVMALASIGTPEVVVPLLGRLDDVDSTVRIEAAEALGHLGEPSAVVPLVGRARDDAPEVRVAVYGALGELGDPRGLPALLQGLRDRAEDPQLAAIAAVGRLGAEEAVEPLVALMQERDPRRARAAVAALGAIGGEPGREAVVEALRPQQTRAVAEEVLLSMARTDREAVLGVLADALSRATSQLHADAIADAIRRVGADAPSEAAERALLDALRSGTGSPAKMLGALAVTGSTDALVPILERLRTGDEVVQGEALEALDLYFARLPADGRAADPLLAALGRVGADRRVLVVRLLGEVGAARALPELRPLLEHRDPALRLAAVEAIGAIGDPEGAEVLLELIDDRDARTRFEAARALATAASADTVVALVGRLTRREPTDRHAVVIALGGALSRLEESGELTAEHASAARAALAAAAGGPDEELAARAIDALGHWGAPGNVPTLAPLLDHPSARRRRAAAQALGHIDAEPAREALRALFDRSDDRPLRTVAAAALGAHGTGEDAARLVRLAREGRWPTPAAASFSLAQLARRGELDAEAMHGDLCALMESRDPFLRANLATAMAATSAPPCPDGPSPLDWLDNRHAASVREAAARWLARAAEAEHLAGDRARQALDRCIERDLSPDVKAACQDPSLAPLDAEADVYAYSADGRRLRTDELVALRLADGTVLVTRTDALGHLRLVRAPRGRLVLDDPVSTPLEP